VRIVIYINPQAKPRMVASDKWKKRLVVEKYWVYKQLIKLSLNQEQQEILEKTEKFESIKFYMALPESWSKKKKKETNNKPHQQTPDIDNLLKGLFDVLMIEDKRVWRIRELEKKWSNKPRIEIEVD